MKPPSHLSAAIPDPELLRDTLAIHEAVQGLVRLYRHRDRDRICCHDISVTQCHALEYLAEEGPGSQNELAHALLLDKSTVSRVVATLEEKGYLVRRQDPGDRRRHEVDITPDGRALVHTIEGEILSREARLVAEIAPDARHAIARYIRTLTSLRSGRLDAPESSCCSTTPEDPSP